jgi:hypothetical protein
MQTLEVLGCKEKGIKMQQKCLLQESSAVEYCLKFLEKQNYKWGNLHYLNKDRYCIAFGREGRPNICIVLKKAWFEKFGEKGFVNEQTGLVERGIGDSLNVEDIREMVQRDVKKIYVVYQDGKIYSIPLMEWLLVSHRWMNKEGKEVRSLSIHYFKRENK